MAVRWLWLAGVLALVGVLGIAPPVTAAADHRVRVARLETDGAARALGIDDRAPKLSWVLSRSGRGAREQASFRVLVASRRELLGVGRADVWDSGVSAASDPWVQYAGSALRAHTRYFWSVRVWSSNGTASRWSRPSWFETGLLSDSDWSGSWIAGPERVIKRLTPEEGLADDAGIRAAGEFCRPTQWPTEDVPPLMSRLTPNNEGECRQLRPVPMLRRSFAVAKRVVSARVYSSGLGYNELRLNGRPADDRVLDPVFTDYSKTVRYTTIDVTRLLRRGENVIASELGSGKYDNSARTWDWGWDEAQ